MLLQKVKNAKRFRYIGNKSDINSTLYYEGFTVLDFLFRKDKEASYLTVDAQLKDPNAVLLVCDMKYLSDHVDGVLQDFIDYVLKEFGNNVLITDTSPDGKEILTAQAREQVVKHMKETVPSVLLLLFNHFMKGRRKRLNELFAMPTYKFVIRERIVEGSTFETGIECLLCGYTSYNKLNVVNYYCEHCFTHHERIK